VNRYYARMSIAVCALAAYAVGAIPWGYLIPRLLKGIDIRTVGSGNIGATNVGRVLGKWWGISVFFLDVAKGFVPAYVLAPFLAAELGIAVIPSQVACGLGAILGHMFPVYIGFRGGKGVATSLGVFLGLAPVPAACALGTWAVVLAATRYMSLGSIIGTASLPAVMVAMDRGRWLGEGWPILALCIFAVLLVIVRHRANLKRLLAGTEPKIGQKKEEAPTT